jgi:hypothetical protein
MSGREQTDAVIREWTQKAENDLKNAVNTLGMVEGCPTDTVCFHAQQCAEKYIKSFLAFRQIEFPKTHDIEELLALMPSGVRIGLGVEGQRALTNYATGAALSRVACDFAGGGPTSRDDGAPRPICGETTLAKECPQAPEAVREP